MWRKALTIPSAVLIDVPPVDTGRGLGAAASLVAFLGALAFLAADDGDFALLRRHFELRLQYFSA